ncbi:MAG: cobalamin biosynthesis protein CobQ [Pseudomonadota bacterium]
MNTPAHLLIGGALAGRDRRLAGWGLLGGALPDLSLYLLIAQAMAQGISERVIFREMYHSDTWQAIFAVDNSAVLWASFLALALWRGWRGGAALCFGALAHIALDLPLHAGDGRAHFWPLSDWVFDSSVSYWDRAHYAAIAAPLEAVCATVAAIFLWRAGGWLRPTAAVLLLAEVWTVRQWLFVFGQ